MKTILIADDEASLRANLCEMLSFEGYNVIEAENGAVALSMIQSDLPDLVICDVAMPEMNGYEVLVDMQQDPVTAAIPLLLLTAQVERASIERGLALGAVDYILKPFTFDDVLSKVLAYTAD